MQQFQNPNYFMQYQPQNQINPYVQRLESMQQYQQAMSPTQMSGTSFTPLGKIVESVDMVKATDIPMDGNMYYFPKADNSEVFGKQWMPDGKTRILTFKPVGDNLGENPTQDAKEVKIGVSDEATKVFSDILNQINERLTELELVIPKTGTKTRAKKGAVEDE